MRDLIAGVLGWLLRVLSERSSTGEKLVPIDNGNDSGLAAILQRKASIVQKWREDLDVISEIVRRLSNQLIGTSTEELTLTHLLQFAPGWVT
jgi:hypothetical protein